MSKQNHSQVSERRSTRKDGWTLVESLVAILILGLFISGSCAVIGAARRAMDSARSHYAAANIAKNRIEKLRTFDLDQLSLLNEHQVQIDHLGNPDGDGDFRRTTFVTNITQTLLDVTVTVEIRNRISWRFEDGGRESVSTYLTEFTEPPEDQ